MSYNILPPYSVDQLAAEKEAEIIDGTLISSTLLQFECEPCSYLSPVKAFDTTPVQAFLAYGSIEEAAQMDQLLDEPEIALQSATASIAQALPEFQSVAPYDTACRAQLGSSACNGACTVSFVRRYQD